ncbi:hypothetical protein A3Q56_00551 [Intoshia linei]|uniref:Uncharacterized protein n=1 Tax=Intoshia linei TaxID=1819745 RepID=A0A177BBN3_9BILA|nr:hypothetical protein A3Q56_00551 [Intoshia linei]
MEQTDKLEIEKKTNQDLLKQLKLQKIKYGKIYLSEKRTCNENTKLKKELENLTNQLKTCNTNTSQNNINSDIGLNYKLSEYEITIKSKENTLIALKKDLTQAYIDLEKEKSLNKYSQVDNASLVQLKNQVDTLSHENCNLENKIKNGNQILINLKNEYSQLNNVYKTCQDKIARFENENSKLIENGNTLTLENDTLKNNLNSVSTLNCQYSTQIDILKERINEFQVGAENLSINLRDETEKRKLLYLDFNKIQIEQKKLIQQNLELKENAKKYEDANIQWSEAYTRLQNELQMKKEIEVQSLNKCTSLQNLNTQYSTDMETLQNLLDESNSQLDDFKLKFQCNEHDDEVLEKYKYDEINYQNNISKLEKEIDEKSVRFNKEMEFKNSKLNQVGSNLMEMTSKYETANNNYTSTCTAYSNLENEKKYLLSEIKNLKLNDMKYKSNENEKNVIIKQLETIKQTNISLSNDNENLKNDNQQLNQKFVNANYTIDSLKKENIETVKKVNLTQKKNDEMKNQLSVCIQQFETLEQETKILKSNSQYYQQEVEKIKNENELLINNNNFYNQELKNVNSKNEKLLKNFESYSKEFDSLNIQLESSIFNVNEFSNKLNLKNEECNKLQSLLNSKIEIIEKIEKNMKNFEKNCNENVEKISNDYNLLYHDYQELKKENCDILENRDGLIIKMEKSFCENEEMSKQCLEMEKMKSEMSLNLIERNELFLKLENSLRLVTNYQDCFKNFGEKVKFENDKIDFFLIQLSGRLNDGMNALYEKVFVVFENNLSFYSKFITKYAQICNANIELCRQNGQYKGLKNFDKNSVLSMLRSLKNDMVDIYSILKGLKTDNDGVMHLSRIFDKNLELQNRELKICLAMERVVSFSNSIFSIEHLERENQFSQLIDLLKVVDDSVKCKTFYSVDDYVDLTQKFIDELNLKSYCLHKPSQSVEEENKSDLDQNYFKEYKFNVIQNIKSLAQKIIGQFCMLENSVESEKLNLKKTAESNLSAFLVLCSKLDAHFELVVFNIAGYFNVQNLLLRQNNAFLKDSISNGDECYNKLVQNYKLLSDKYNETEKEKNKLASVQKEDQDENEDFLKLLEKQNDTFSILVESLNVILTFFGDLYNLTVPIIKLENFNVGDFTINVCNSFYLKDVLDKIIQSSVSKKFESSSIDCQTEDENEIDRLTTLVNEKDNKIEKIQTENSFLNEDFEAAQEDLEFIKFEYDELDKKFIQEKMNCEDLINSLNELGVQITQLRLEKQDLLNELDNKNDKNDSNELNSNNKNIDENGKKSTCTSDDWSAIMDLDTYTKELEEMRKVLLLKQKDIDEKGKIISTITAQKQTATILKIQAEDVLMKSNYAIKSFVDGCLNDVSNDFFLLKNSSLDFDKFDKIKMYIEKDYDMTFNFPKNILDIKDTVKKFLKNDESNSLNIIKFFDQLDDFLKKIVYYFYQDKYFNFSVDKNVMVISSTESLLDENLEDKDIYGTNTLTVQVKSEVEEIECRNKQGDISNLVQNEPLQDANLQDIQEYDSHIHESDDIKGSAVTDEFCLINSSLDLSISLKSDREDEKPDFLKDDIDIVVVSQIQSNVELANVKEVLTNPEPELHTFKHLDVEDNSTTKNIEFEHYGKRHKKKSKKRKNQKSKQSQEKAYIESSPFPSMRQRH